MTSASSAGMSRAVRRGVHALAHRTGRAGRTRSSCRRGRTGPRSAGRGRSRPRRGRTAAGLVALQLVVAGWRTSCRCSPRPAAGGWRRTVCPSSLHPSAVTRTARSSAAVIVCRRGGADRPRGHGRPDRRRARWGAVQRRQGLRPARHRDGADGDAVDRRLRRAARCRSGRERRVDVARRSAPTGRRRSPSPSSTPTARRRYRFYTDGTSAPLLTPGGAARPPSAALVTGGLGLVLEPMATAIESVVAQASAATCWCSSTSTAGRRRSTTGRRTSPGCAVCWPVPTSSRRATRTSAGCAGGSARRARSAATAVVLVTAGDGGDDDPDAGGFGDGRGRRRARRRHDRRRRRLHRRLRVVVAGERARSRRPRRPGRGRALPCARPTRSPPSSSAAAAPTHPAAPTSRPTGSERQGAGRQGWPRSVHDG